MREELIKKEVEKTAKLKELAIKRKSTAKERRGQEDGNGEIGWNRVNGGVEKMLLHKMMVEKFFTD